MPVDSRRFCRRFGDERDIKFFTSVAPKEENIYLCCMIGLVRHIEYLLLHNDRVAVPGLGCFVVDYREARLLPDATSMLPPVRGFRFEASAIDDDSLLVRSVMRAGFMSGDEARNAIAGEVKSIRENLKQSCEYPFGRLGRFIWSDGAVSFQVADNNPLEYPRFGFAPVEILSGEEQLPREEVNEPVDEVEESSDRIYISFRRRTIRVASVAAAVILFLLMLSKPINTPDTTVNYAGVLSTELFEKTAETVVEKPAGEMVAPVALDERTLDAAAGSALVQDEVRQQAIDSYYIIVASLPTKNLAEKQIECFRQQGNTAKLHIYETPRKARLYIASFGNFKEARQYLSRLVKEQPLFANAWIMNAHN